jgi:predicted phosphoadenosine phosphosulfate sulfurtransferase
MTPKIELTLFDDTKFKLQLSLLRRRIAVLVSGGLDSAVLYYLVKYLSLQDSRYDVTPYTLDREDGSKTHAQPVIDYVHDKLNCDRRLTRYVPLSTQDSNMQVSQGLSLVLKKTTNIIYLGYIKTLPEHAMHGVPPPFVAIDTEIVKHPFMSLTKAHIVDIAIKLDTIKLFELTHSCVYDIVGRCGVCNRCNERAWAFEQLSLDDPGTK